MSNLLTKVPCKCGKEKEYTIATVKIEHLDSFIKILNVPQYRCDSCKTFSIDVSKVDFRKHVQYAETKHISEIDYNFTVPYAE